MATGYHAAALQSIKIAWNYRKGNKLPLIWAGSWTSTATLGSQATTRGVIDAVMRSARVDGRLAYLVGGRTGLIAPCGGRRCLDSA
jgi:hypothetical protein